jgi:hypothetical protein
LHAFVAQGGRLFWADGCEPLSVEEILPQCAGSAA